MTTTTLANLIASSDPATAASASRLLLKAKKAPTVDELKVVGRARDMAASSDPTAAAFAMQWLSARGLSFSAPEPSRTAQKTASRVLAVTDRARREGWSKTRRAAEIQKVLNTRRTA